MRTQLWCYSLSSLSLKILTHCTKCLLENDTASPAFMITPINTVANVSVVVTNERHLGDILCRNTHKHSPGVSRNYVKAFWFTTYIPLSTWELASAGGNPECTFRKVMDEEATGQHMIGSNSRHSDNALSEDECIHVVYPIKSQGWWTDLFLTISHKPGS